MEKTWLIGTIGLFILLISFLISSLTYEPAGFEMTEQSFYEERILDSGIDKDLLIPTQMQPIAEMEMTFLKTFATGDYTGMSNNPIIFSRNWGSKINVDWDHESTIDPDVYLFEYGENYYSVIATFSVPYSFNTEEDVIGYLDVKHSNNFYVSTWYAISYIKDDVEQRIQSGSLAFEENTSIVPIYQNNQPVRNGYNKELIYTFIITFTPSEDNDLELDMYLSTDLDFYFKNTSSVEKVQLGFNEFKTAENRHEYRPIRKTVRYRKEQ